MTELCKYKGTTTTVDTDLGVIWIGVTECPSNADITHMWTTVSTFVVNYPKELIIHIQHIETKTLESLPVSTMMHLLSMVTKQKLKLKCIIFQAMEIDDKVKLACNMFGALNPDLKLEMCDASTVKDILQALKCPPTPVTSA